MKAGRITAKLRDAVPVCLMVNGAEVGRYKNIELPDEIKALDIMDFGFITSLTGKFDFNLYFDEGVLPEVLPGVRAKITRAEKRAAKVAAAMKAELLAAQDATTETIEAETPAVPETTEMDAADEVQSKASTEVPVATDEMTATGMVEPVTDTPKRRGRPKTAERNEKHSA